MNTQGPVLPSKKEDLQRAYVARLKQIEMEDTHKQKTTEVCMCVCVCACVCVHMHTCIQSHMHTHIHTCINVCMCVRARAHVQVDLWLEAVDRAGGLPRSTPLFSIQEKLFEHAFKDLGSIDRLDPALDGKIAGQARVTDDKLRQEQIVQRLAEIGVPGNAVVHKGIAQAVLKRNNATFLHDAEEDSWANLEQNQYGDFASEIKSEDWGVDKLVALRTEVYKANRKYRKSKKKFDRSVKECLLMEDLDRAHEDLLPWKCLWESLYRAFVYNDSGPSGWRGLRSSVRAQAHLLLQVLFRSLRYIYTHTHVHIHIYAYIHAYMLYCIMCVCVCVCVCVCISHLLSPTFVSLQAVRDTRCVWL